jgi:H+/Cl- antiporter ClcA
MPWRQAGSRTAFETAHQQAERWRPDMTTPVAPYTVMRSRAYVRLLVTAAVLGAPLAAIAFWFLKLIQVSQGWLFSDLPEAVGFREAPLWWPLLPLFVGGLVVGLAVRYLPGHGGHSPADGINVGGGPPMPRQLVGIVLAAVASLAFGATLGPEAPLIAIGGGLAYATVRLAGRAVPEQTGAVVAATGSNAAISTLLGSPLSGAFLLMEASGLGGPLATLVLIPGLLAAGIGSLIFLGLGSLTGYGTFSLAIPDPPAFSQIQAVEFLWAVAIGILAAPVAWAMVWLARAVRRYAEPRPIVLTPTLGLAIATLAIAYQAATGKPVSDVLFSGQNELPALISHSAEYTAGMLLLLLLCKGLAFACAMAGFRGGAVFPSVFLGAAAGVLLSHLPGLPVAAGVAIGMGAMTAGVLKLPLTAVLLTTLLLGAEGVAVMPLVITASVVSYVVSVRLMPAPPAQSPTPEPTSGPQTPRVPRPQSREPHIDRPAPRA